MCSSESVVNGMGERKLLTPVRAIRANCLECCCRSPKAVRECHLCDCPLWPYRLGKRPKPCDVPA